MMQIFCQFDRNVHIFLRTSYICGKDEARNIPKVKENNLKSCEESVRLTYRVFSKSCVFPNPPQPIPRLQIAVRDFQSAEIVQSHSYWLAIFYTTNNSPEFAREKSQNTKKFLEKTQFFETTCTLIRSKQ